MVDLSYLYTCTHGFGVYSVVYLKVLIVYNVCIGVHDALLYMHIYSCAFWQADQASPPSCDNEPI